LEEVYCGVWGFQCILSMASLTCVFFAFNHASFSLGLVNCGATIFTHYGLREVLGQVEPYNLNIEASLSIIVPFLARTSSFYTSLHIVHHAIDFDY